MNSNIKLDLEKILSDSKKKLGDEDLLKIDLHCHDKNSDKPSEALGRILGIPETWLETDDLLSCLKENKTTATTITNHNNARSCWDLMDRGYDILSGAEFSCKLPSSDIIIHVLTYGFDPSQEVTLNRLRNNLYNFLTYCNENDILTVWAHPLYTNINNFSVKAVRDLEHIATLFTHYELINGQRDSRQNLVTYHWLNSFNEEKVDSIIRSYGVNISNICKDPFEVNFVGGSDDHMGLFAGSSGTLVKIPDLNNRLKFNSKADLVLESLKQGLTAPYGTYTEAHKMSISFIEYLYMIIKNMKDPGLLRVMLHKGTEQEKLTALLLSNGVEELRRHKYTLSFLKSFHKSLHGKGPHLWQQTFIKKSAKPFINEMENISKVNKSNTYEYTGQIKSSLFNIFSILSKRGLDQSIFNLSKQIQEKIVVEEESIESLLDKVELPANLRSLFNNDNVNIGNLFDKLSFPILGSFVIGASNFISDKVLHNNRGLLDYFSEESGYSKKSSKILWLTDTYNDKNGIAISIKSYREEVIKHDLPIDFLICSDEVESGEKLIVTKPLLKFDFPYYKEQEIRIPNLMEIHKIFKNGGYDKIICSTEFVMGFVSLYLKSCFNTEAFFFMHTDWLEFAKRTLSLSRNSVKQLIRFSRFFYSKFDKLFVLNSDHKKWLTNKTMNVPKESIKICKHWVSDIFKPIEPNFKERIRPKTLLYVGRLSKEKGLLDLPYIFKSISEEFPETKLIIVGTGPLKGQLMSMLPEAIFVNWLNQDELASIYSKADFLLFPSRFDTFGRVVLESISCGCPVAAYNFKGPKDILEHMKSGLLVDNKYELVEYIKTILKNYQKHKFMKKCAIERSKEFTKRAILNELLENTGLNISNNLYIPNPLFTSKSKIQ